mgnify:FL=1
MNRRDVLRGLGLVGLGSMIPSTKAISDDEKSLSIQSGRTCFLTPQETEGPYYFNPNLLRQDVRTDTPSGTVYTGLQLNLLFSVINLNCEPIPNVLVDIWHCSKDGVYSGYAGQPGGISTVGMNFLRGTQLTDANGQCSFITIYPGWYPGRVTHIHFKVDRKSTRLNSSHRT